MRDFSVFEDSAAFFAPLDPAVLDDPGEGPGRGERPDPKPPVPNYYGKDEVNSGSRGPEFEQKGALDMLAARFWQPKRHLTIVQAGANLSRGLPVVARNVNLLGHGNQGQLDVGAGDRMGDDTNQLGWWNVEELAGQIERIGAGYRGVITIYACRTGGGHGNDFLWRLARITGHVIKAYTGLLTLYSNRFPIEFQKGGAWQVASPDMPAPPPAIASPPMPQHILEKGYWIAGSIGIDLDQVEGVSGSILRAGRPMQVSARGQLAKDLARHAFGASPFPHTAAIPGLVSAQLAFTTAGGASWRLTVIADAVARLDDGTQCLVDAMFEQTLARL